MKYILISNNPIVIEKYPDAIYVSGAFIDVLIKVRDYIHQGYSLMIHPLAGSVKPNETPYKSILLNNTKLEKVDFRSLSLIEDALVTANKFQNLDLKYSKSVLNDFQLIDFSLLEAAFESLS